MDRAQPVDEILLLFERFAGNAVPTFVMSFVDVARRRHPAHQLLHARFVSGLGGPDEIVE